MDLSSPCQVSGVFSRNVRSILLAAIGVQDLATAITTIESICYFHKEIPSRETPSSISFLATSCQPVLQVLLQQCCVRTALTAEDWLAIEGNVVDESMDFKKVSDEDLQNVGEALLEFRCDLFFF